MDGIQQRNPQSFAFRAASAVIGLFSAQVALDFCIGHVPEFHLYRCEVHLLETGGDAHHGHGGLEHHRVATHAAQLLHRTLMVAWFAQRLAVQVRHLV
ncbi:hypothetical protein D3C71_1688500 [compost metagenome]